MRTSVRIHLDVFFVQVTYSANTDSNQPKSIGRSSSRETCAVIWSMEVSRPAAPTPESARPPMSVFTFLEAPQTTEPISKMVTDARRVYFPGYMRRIWEKKRMKAVWVSTNELATQPCCENYCAA
jgi:hypothetical protein